MDKSVKFVKNSLKFKAHTRNNAITVRLGARKLVIPMEARLIHNDGFLFLSFSALSEIYKLEGKNLVALAPTEDGAAAHAALTPSSSTKKRGRKKSSRQEVSSELREALSKIPAGTKLVFDKSGGYKIVTKRTRTKKA